MGRPSQGGEGGGGGPSANRRAMESPSGHANAEIYSSAGSLSDGRKAKTASNYWETMITDESY